MPLAQVVAPAQPVPPHCAYSAAPAPTPAVLDATFELEVEVFDWILVRSVVGLAEVDIATEVGLAGCRLVASVVGTGALDAGADEGAAFPPAGHT